VARRETVDWVDVLKRLDAGEDIAFLELSRLVTRFLARMRAYDFLEDWPDLLQEVCMATLSAFRGGRIRDPTAVPAFVAQVTRHKFSDRLRQVERRHEKSAVPLAEDGGDPEPPAWSAPADDDVLDLRSALERLREPHRSLVMCVYGEQMTYQEAARKLEVPLGSAKRYIAQALRELRSLLTERGSADSPSQRARG
jgi:RNA polymerase sigma-70 factor (ECF subfamily)